MKIIDLTGQKFHRLTVVERALNKSPKDTNARWLCMCECGNSCIAYGQDLRRDKFKSCGCLNAERITKHGRSRTRVYMIWKGIIQRAANVNSPYYAFYGAKGIGVCEEWLKFENFFADMGDRPSGYSVDRIDNTKGYSKDNCRWADSKTQNNNKSNNFVVEFRGKSQTLQQWSEELGVGRHALEDRLKRLGWSVEKALTTPVKTYKPRSK